MKFGIDMGHNAPPDVGASGWDKEDVLTKAVGTKVISKLQALGHTAINCTPTRAYSVMDSLRKRVYMANVKDVDIYVSIHFNAFNGHAMGTEVYAVSDAGRKIAQPVLNSIVNLGFYNRGVKSGSHLYVLKYTNMPSILIEGCFIDSYRDRDLYNTEQMANAIVEGLTGQNPGEIASSPSTPSTASSRILKLQQALNRLGIKDKEGKTLVEDGLIGPATRSATRRFNDLMAIDAGDYASTATWTAIEEIFDKPLMRPNHATGEAVRYVQLRVGTAIDGVYGPKTALAVEQFQNKNCLTVDGIIGSQSWAKLIG